MRLIRRLSPPPLVYDRVHFLSSLNINNRSYIILRASHLHLISLSVASAVPNLDVVSPFALRTVLSFVTNPLHVGWRHPSLFLTITGRR